MRTLCVGTHADGACGAMHTHGADANNAGVMCTLHSHTHAELDVRSGDLRRLRSAGEVPLQHHRR